MDINELLSNHQRALMNASQAQSRNDESTYFGVGAYYAKRIRDYRDGLGLPRYPSWFLQPQSTRFPLSHGMKAIEQ